MTLPLVPGLPILKMPTPALRVPSGRSGEGAVFCPRVRGPGGPGAGGGSFMLDVACSAWSLFRYPLDNAPDMERAQ